MFTNVPINLSWWVLVYAYVPWALCAIAAVVVLWAMISDRARGRRRCPRCWYDMKGVPGLRCPECGREARHERSLARTRRRWRLAAVGGLLLLGAWGVDVTPRVQRAGAVGLVPTWVLAGVSLVYETGEQGMFGEMVQRLDYDEEKLNAPERWIVGKRLGRAFRECDTQVTLKPRWTNRWGAMLSSSSTAGAYALALVERPNPGFPSLSRAAIQMLGHTRSTSLRLHIVDFMRGEQWGPEVTPILAGVLRNDDAADVRTAAAVALGQAGGEPTMSVEALAGGLDDGSANVRIACCESLARHGDRANSATAKLAAICETEENASVSLAAMRCLRAIGTAEAEGRLCDLAFNGTKYARRMSMQIISRRDAPACRCAKRLSEPAANGEDGGRQALAVTALAGLAGIECDIGSVLAGAAKGAIEPRSRAEALRAIWARSLLGNHEIVRLAETTLNDGSERVRREAARALASVLPREKSAEPALHRALNDPDDVVRFTAVRALELQAEAEQRP